MSAIDKNIKTENDCIIWNPWTGCRWISKGCNNCYIGKKCNNAFDKIRYNKQQFYLPVRMTRVPNPNTGKTSMEYKILGGSKFKVCEYSDFFLPEADYYRKRAWKIIRERKDCLFSITTKRIDRFNETLPDNWYNGWHNVEIGVSIEDQFTADTRVSKLLEIEAKHKFIEVSPLIERIDLKKYLSTGSIEKVIVRGETGEGHKIRVCDMNLVKDIREQCKLYDVCFIFEKTGSKFLYGDAVVRIKPKDEFFMADFYNLNLNEDNIDWRADKEELDNIERIEKAAEIYEKIKGGKD